MRMWRLIRSRIPSLEHHFDAFGIRGVRRAKTESWIPRVGDEIAPNFAASITRALHRLFGRHLFASTVDRSTRDIFPGNAPAVQFDIRGRSLRAFGSAG